MMDFFILLFPAGGHDRLTIMRCHQEKRKLPSSVAPRCSGGGFKPLPSVAMGLPGVFVGLGWGALLSLEGVVGHQEEQVRTRYTYSLKHHAARERVCLSLRKVTSGEMGKTDSPQINEMTAGTSKCSS